MTPARLRSFAFTTLLLIYGLLVGGTYNGILNPNLKLLTMIVISGGAAVWAIARFRSPSRWVWRRSPLDTAILIWAASFVMSLLANTEGIRRILMGMWYMGFYIVLWYALHDLISNRVLSRDTLMDALLVVGVFVVAVGFLQFVNAVKDGANIAELRPVSLLGNANTLAAFLVMIIPLIFERLGSPRLISRLLMTLFAMFAVLLLLLSGSRGGWLGLAAGIAARVALFAYERKLYTPSGLRAAWARLPLPSKLALVTILFVIAAGSFIAALFLIDSLNAPGRSLELRTFIYDTAVTMFTEKPITGHGLFTFGGGLVRLNSTPPTEPHSHAHSILLGTAAELGIIGLFALGLTIVVIVLAIRTNVNRLDARDKRALRAGVGALAAFGAHHLLDLPAMMPTIFITMLILLAMTITPPAHERDLPVPARSPLRIGVAFGVIALILSGWFGTITYSLYVDALRGVTVENAGVRAAQLQSVINLDPLMPVYYQQQGLLYAAAGDFEHALVAWQRYTELAPEYVAGWINLGVVYAAMGDYEHALQAAQHAQTIAPAHDLSATIALYTQNAQTNATPLLLTGQSADPRISDIPFNENIDQIQFLRLALPRQLLPTLGE